MGTEFIHILMLGIDAMIALAVILVLYFVHNNRITDEELIKAKKIMQEYEHEKREKKYKKFFFRNDKSYEKMQIYLSRVGASFRVGKNVTPIEFLISKFLTGVFFALVGVSVFGIAGCFAGIIGYSFPDMVLNVMNNRDNDKMLEDIKSLYDAMLISLEAGVFLTEAFANSYKMIDNARLKKAVLELNSEIIATNDMEVAIDKFELKFRNQYINHLCVILRQQSEVGLSLTMIADMSNQMTDVTKALNIRKKQKLDNQAFIAEMMIFGGIMVVCLYICFSLFTGTMSEL